MHMHVKKMADVTRIIVEHLIFMHREVFSEMQNSETCNNKNCTMGQKFELLTSSLKDIALSFSPKENQIIELNKT